MLSRRCFISPLPSPASPPWLPNVASMSLSFPLLPPLPSFSLSGAALRSFSSFQRSPPLRSSRLLPGFSLRASRGSSSSRARSDYYDTMNVDRDATLQEIKSAYRKLARQMNISQLHRDPWA